MSSYFTSKWNNDNSSFLNFQTNPNLNYFISCLLLDNGKDIDSSILSINLLSFYIQQIFKLSINDLENNLQKEGKNIFAISDCCGSIKNKHNHKDSVSFIGLKTKKIIVSSFLNNNNNENIYKEEDNTQYSLEYCCNYLYSKGYNLQYYLHGGNKSCMNIIYKYFPNCKELLCIKESAKYLNKYIKEHFKYSKIKQLNIKSWFINTCIDSSKVYNNNEYFIDKLECFLNHFSGYHDNNCLNLHTQQYNYNININDIYILYKLFSLFSKESEKYSHNKTQIQCELFHKLKSYYAKSYQLKNKLSYCRLAFILLIYNNGFENTIKLIYNSLSIKIPKNIFTFLKILDTKKFNSDLNLSNNYILLLSNKQIIYSQCNCNGNCKTNKCKCFRNGNICEQACGCLCKQTYNIKESFNKIFILPKPKRLNKYSIEYIINK